MVALSSTVPLAAAFILNTNVGSAPEVLEIAYLTPTWTQVIVSSEAIAAGVASRL